jgi:hyperosmotically inducible protein
MRITTNTFLCAIAGATLLACIPMQAQETNPDRMVRQIRHELIMLPYYGVFDNFMFQVKGREVRLMGQVRLPSLKRSAENVVKSVSGVETVVNEIEVLPTSPNDDRLRLAVYRAIYGDNALNRYALQAVPPIHIIIKNGHLTLVGVVATEFDKNIANMRASGVSGIFSVKNELTTEKEAHPK